MIKMFESLNKMIREKAEYKAYRELLESLPEDYQFVSKEIEKYMFSIMIDESVMPVLMNTVESFAVAAEKGRSILLITGTDAGLFCDDLMSLRGAERGPRVRCGILNVALV